MTSGSNSKINLLLSSWPAGTVAVLPWLEKQGVYQQLAYQYERSGWLNRIGAGAYARLNEKVYWTGAVFAIQTQLKLPVHVAAKTALELKGFSHFVAAGEGSLVYLFGRKDTPLPRWFLRHRWQRKVHYHVPKLFEDKEASFGITSHQMGGYELRLSAPERAILEMLHLAPKEQSIEEAFQLMEGLTTLRPDVVQRLLKSCRSIKVKRLFLALAERCNHSWLTRVNTARIDVGKGKRVVVPGGRLDKKYLVTLPPLGEPEGGEGP